LVPVDERVEAIGLAIVDPVVQRTLKHIGRADLPRVPPHRFVVKWQGPNRCPPSGEQGDDGGLPGQHDRIRRQPCFHHVEDLDATAVGYREWYGAEVCPVVLRQVEAPQTADQKRRQGDSPPLSDPRAHLVRPGIPVEQHQRPDWERVPRDFDLIGIRQQHNPVEKKEYLEHREPDPQPTDESRNHQRHESERERVSEPEGAHASFAEQIPDYCTGVVPHPL